ncbi:MAG: hypothetical protein ACOH1P_09360 [Lysobacter sp.]
MVILLGSLLVCVRGVIHNPGILESHWLNPVASSYGAAVILAALLVALQASRLLETRYSLLLVMLAALMAAAFSGVGAVAVVSLQMASGFCIGRRIYGNELVQAHGVLLSATVATATGLAVLSFFVGLLALVPMNNPATYLFLLAAPIAWGWKNHAQALGEVMRAWGARPVSATLAWTQCFSLVVAFALAVRLLAVLHPEVGSDALAMHLVIADQMKVDGRFHFDVTQSIWAVMPMASDWQFAVSNMLGGEHAARLLNYAAELLMVCFIHQYVVRNANVLAASISVAIYVTTPLLFLETTSLFAENFWALWLVAALLVAEASTRTGDARNAAGMGLLLGTALAAKVITLFSAPFFLALGITWIIRFPLRWLPNLGALLGAAFAASLTPYLNAWWRTGNPVFPFMNQYFNSPHFDSVTAFDNPLFSAGFHWRTLYDLTFHTGSYLEAYPGAMGLAFLVLLPAAIVFSLLVAWRTRFAMVFSIAFVAMVFYSQSYLRYILPMLPIFAAAIGLMASGLIERSKLVGQGLLTVILGCVLAGLYFTPSSNFHHREISLPVFAGSEAEEEYLERNRPERMLVKAIDSMQFEKILWLGAPYIAGVDADVYLLNWHGGWRQRQEYDALDSADSLRDWFANYRFEAIAVASDFNRCQRQILCDFLEDKTLKIYDKGLLSLYVINPGSLFDREMLNNPTFDHDISGWGGGGYYVPEDGAVSVSSLQSLSQVIAVNGKTRYYLEVAGRCGSGDVGYRSQVNWLGRSGNFISTDIEVEACSPDFKGNGRLVTSPAGATQAVVYASGHAPDKLVEITKVSFRQ